MTLLKHIQGLDYESLLQLRTELTERTLLVVVEERIRAFENPNWVCPVCGIRLDPAEAITLHFGPSEFRRRASFDGEDCLRHFVLGMLRK